jgi:hypothetical protein
VCSFAYCEIVFWSFSSAGQVRSLDLWMGIASVLPVVLTERQERARLVARTGNSVPLLPAGIVSLLSPRHQVFCAVAIIEDGCFLHRLSLSAANGGERWLWRRLLLFCSLTSFFSLFSQPFVACFSIPVA